MQKKEKKEDTVPSFGSPSSSVLNSGIGKRYSHQFAPVADLQTEISAITSHCTEDDGEPTFGMVSENQPEMRSQGVDRIIHHVQWRYRQTHAELAHSCE